MFIFSLSLSLKSNIVFWIPSLRGSEKPPSQPQKRYSTAFPPEEPCVKSVITADHLDLNEMMHLKSKKKFNSMEWGNNVKRW